MTTVMSLIYAPSAVALLISVLVGLALLIQPRSEPPAELVAAISGWPPPALGWGPPTERDMVHGPTWEGIPRAWLVRQFNTPPLPHTRVG